MSCHGRIVILHRSGKDGPTYYLRQRVCTIGRSRGCNIRMNLDQVAEQHAWITMDSKNQVWIANATEGQELRVNSKVLPAGSRPTQLFHSSIIYIEGRTFRFEEEAMIQEKTIDKDSPENMVVEESPIKEKQPPADVPTKPKSDEQHVGAAKNPTPGSVPTATTTPSTNASKEGAPRVGAKRSLAQSFDEVEQSPAKRQRIEEPANLSQSAEVPSNTKTSSTKKSCLTPAKNKKTELKQKTLHQVSFALPGKSVVKPLASSETDPSTKKPSSNSSSDQPPKKVSLPAKVTPTPSPKKPIVPKKSKYQARYVESKGKRNPKPPPKKPDGKPVRRQSFISVILGSSSESESEESEESESEEESKKKTDEPEKKAKKGGGKKKSDSEESESDSEESDSKKKPTQPPPQVAPSKPNKSTVKRPTESPEDSVSKDDADQDSEQPDDGSDCKSSHGDSDGECSDKSDGNDKSDASDSESESTVEDKKKDGSDKSKEVAKAAPSKDSSSSASLVKESAATEDPSSSSATSYRKTSSDILREEEAKDLASQQSVTQQNPTATVLREAKREPTHETSSLASSQTVPAPFSLEERISQIREKEGLDAVSSADDLKAALIATFRKLGCDKEWVIKEIIDHTSLLLPKSYKATDLNWGIKLTDTLLVITDVTPRKDALYYRLKNEYFPTSQQKLCDSAASSSPDPEPKRESCPQHSTVSVRYSEEILINGSYEEILVRLTKKQALLADITKRNMEPESIKALKRSHKVADKKDHILCGGLSDDEVRLVLSALAELFPNVTLEFTLSSLFTTAAAIVLLSRRLSTHHDDILAKIGTRCVEVQSKTSAGSDCFVLKVKGRD